MRRPNAIPVPSHVRPPALSGRWSVRYQVDDAAEFQGRLVVEDEDGLVVAEVPYGIGCGRLGFVKAEQIAKQIAALPHRGGE